MRVVRFAACIGEIAQVEVYSGTGFGGLPAQFIVYYFEYESNLNAYPNATGSNGKDG
jgi:hypothetical protein